MMKKKRVIVIFKKSTDKFAPTCLIDRDEVTELLETKNFGARENWKKVKKNIIFTDIMNSRIDITIRLKMNFN
jgi:hypothetical protein